MADEARPRLALAGLLALTLLTFAGVFEDGPYPGPALVAMLLAGGIAVAGSRAGLRPAVVLLVSGGGLLWYLVAIFAGRLSWYGFPSAPAIRSLGRAIERAYGHSQVDYAPVPVRPGYVILVVIAMWVCATWGEIATSRWKAPGAALIPPIGLFALVLVVGTRAGAPFLVAAFLTVALTYLSLAARAGLGSWGRAVRRRGADVVTPLARRMAAASLAAAFIAPAALPALGDGMVAWRQSGGSGAGGAGGGSGIVNPLVQIAPTLVEQSDQVLFRVTADRPAYWRLVSLTQFDGETWRPDAEARVTASDGRIQPRHGANVQVVRVVDQTFDLTGLDGMYLPGATTPISVTGLGERQGDLRAHPFTSDLVLQEGIDPPLEYSVRSTVPHLSRKELLAAQPGTLEPVYTNLPPLDPAVSDLLTTWTGKAKTPGEKLIAIQDRLRGFGYHVPETAEEVAAQRDAASSDYLTSFLTEIRTGYCQQFATAFALLARSLGYPSRVSVGFLPGSALEGEGAYDVRGTDAHAWPEVYFERYGWVPFEPTPRGEAAIPRYTLSPLAVNGNFQAGDASIFAPGVRAGNLGADADLAGAGDTRRGRLARRARPDRSKQSTALLWAEAFASLLTRTLVVVVAGLALVPAIKALRLRRRYRHARGPRAVAAAAFAHFEDEARDLAGPRSPAESGRRYAARLGAADVVPVRPAARLAALYEAAQYAPEPPDGVQAAEARRIAALLAREMWTRAGWRLRAVRLFSPRSLLRGS